LETYSGLIAGCLASLNTCRYWQGLTTHFTGENND
jgi:hypothetical protein